MSCMTDLLELNVRKDNILILVSLAMYGVLISSHEIIRFG